MKLVAAFLAMAFVFAGVSTARAEMKTEVVEYRHGDVVLEGYLAYDDSFQGKRPGILVAHEWNGHNPYVRKRAEQLARLGYVAFALDMYGKGVLAKDAKEADALAGIYKGDRKLMRARAAAGLPFSGAVRRPILRVWPRSGTVSAGPPCSNWPGAGGIWLRWSAFTGGWTPRLRRMPETSRGRCWPSTAGTTRSSP